MKKLITLSISILLFISFTQAQNLVTNPGYEDDPTTYIVGNELRRVDNLTPTATVSGNPSSASIPVTAGMWVKKAANSGYIKGVLTTTDFNSGSNCMTLRILAGGGQTGLNKWYNTVNLQKLTTGLSHTKKYIASVWAKAAPTTNNQCTQFVMFITDNTLKTNFTATIPLTGGTTWTEYTATFDLPTFLADKPTADFSTTFFGIGIVTTYNDANKTLESKILLDDFYLAEEIVITATAETGGTITSGAGSYAMGASATVVAEASEGYQFVNWTLDTSAGAVQSTDASYTFTASANTTLIANFESTISTSTVTPADENVSVFVNAQNQLVINANSGTNYAIYNAVGQQVAKGKVINNLAFTINNSKGVFVVKVGNVTKKVIIK